MGARGGRLAANLEDDRESAELAFLLGPPPKNPHQRSLTNTHLHHLRSSAQAQVARCLLVVSPISPGLF